MDLDFTPQERAFRHEVRDFPAAARPPVQPIITLDGDHEINEVFFTDVRTPVRNLVSEENSGWTHAQYLLTYERTSMAGIGASTAAMTLLKTLSARQGAEEAIQFHGSTGTTENLAASHFAERLMTIDHPFGDTDHRLQRFIELGRAA